MFSIGHQVSPSTVKTVLTKVKNLKTVYKEMDYNEVIDFDSADCVDKVVEFWVKKSHKWCELKAILMTCNEVEAVSHVEWLESYNQEGTFISLLSVNVRV